MTRSSLDRVGAPLFQIPLPLPFLRNCRAAHVPPADHRIIFKPRRTVWINFLLINCRCSSGHSSSSSRQKKKKKKEDEDDPHYISSSSAVETALSSLPADNTKFLCTPLEFWIIEILIVTAHNKRVRTDSSTLLECQHYYRPIWNQDLHSIVNQHQPKSFGKLLIYLKFMWKNI